MDENGRETTVLYDVTILHTTSPSSLHTTVEASIRRKIREKEDKYLAKANASGMSFVVLPLRSHGGLAPATMGLLTALTALTGRPLEEVIGELQHTLHTGNGVTLRSVVPFSLRSRRNRETLRDGAQRHVEKSKRE